MLDKIIKFIIINPINKSAKSHIKMTTLIQHYQNTYPNLLADGLYAMMASDAFIRRMSVSGFDVVPKGSFITRQYFARLQDRLPNDLDVVFIHHIENPQKAEQLFDAWLKYITTMNYVDDGVQFLAFDRKQPWEDLDYSMSQTQDFCTVNTQEVHCIIDGRHITLSIDISFNLKMPMPITSLIYKTPTDDIYLPSVPSLSLQIAWKIHQLFVCARLKDMYDLIELLPKLTDNDSKEVIQLLTIECQRDNIPLDKIHKFTQGKFIFNDYILNNKTAKTNLFFNSERKMTLEYCPKLKETYQDICLDLKRSIQHSKLNNHI